MSTKTKPGEKSLMETMTEEADARLKDAYKVKSIVIDRFTAGDLNGATAELNLFFSTMFDPKLFHFNRDKEELVKQANKLFAKSELYGFVAIQDNLFPGLGVALNYSQQVKTRLDEGYRTLYLLLKNASAIPFNKVYRFNLTDEVCKLYTENIRKQLDNEFGNQITTVFSTDGTICDKKLYRQVVDFATRHTPLLFKDEIEQRQLPAVLVEIALRGMKAFAFPTER